MRALIFIAALACSCRGAQAPASDEHIQSQRATVTGDEQNATSSSGALEVPSGAPTRVEGGQCGEPGLEAFRGVVEHQGTNFVLKTGGRAVPLWENSQQEAMAPRSPDLSGQVGQEVTICGEFDGSAIYRASAPQK